MFLLRGRTLLDFGELRMAKDSAVLSTPAGGVVELTVEGSKMFVTMEVIKSQDYHVAGITNKQIAWELETPRKQYLDLVRGATAPGGEPAPKEALSVDAMREHVRLGHASYDSRCELCVRFSGVAVSRARAWSL